MTKVKKEIKKGDSSACYNECLKVIKIFLENQGGAYADSISYVQGTVYKECEDGFLDWITPVAKIELTKEGVKSKGKILYRQIQAILMEYDIASMSFDKLNPMIETITIRNYENFSFTNVSKSIVLEEGLNVTCLILEEDINEVEACGISEIIRAKAKSDYYRDFDVTAVVIPTRYNNVIDAFNLTTDYYEISIPIDAEKYEIGRLSEVSNYLKDYNKDILNEAHNKKVITIFAYGRNRNKKGNLWKTINKKKISISNHLLDIE